METTAADERRFYQKITDIYALAVDYDAHAPLTRDFFATVQNKFHWAITGQTAADENRAERGNEDGGLVRLSSHLPPRRLEGKPERSAPGPRKRGKKKR